MLTARKLEQLLHNLPEDQKDLEIILQPEADSCPDYGYNCFNIRLAYFDNGEEIVFEDNQHINCIVIS